MNNKDLGKGMFHNNKNVSSCSLGMSLHCWREALHQICTSHNNNYVELVVDMNTNWLNTCIQDVLDKIEAPSLEIHIHLEAHMNYGTKFLFFWVQHLAKRDPYGNDNMHKMDGDCNIVS